MSAVDLEASFTVQWSESSNACNNASLHRCQRLTLTAQIQVHSTPHYIYHTILYHAMPHHTTPHYTAAPYSFITFLLNFFTTTRPHSRKYRGCQKMLSDLTQYVYVYTFLTRHASQIVINISAVHSSYQIICQS